MPSSDKNPGVVTTTEPPAPVPAVELAICAPAVTEICEADAATDPASPLAVSAASAMIPVPTPLKASGPCALTPTVPPLPAPNVADEICAPPDMVSAPPAARVISPALPIEPGVAEAVTAVPEPDSVASPAIARLTSPPLPRPPVLVEIPPPL